MLKVSNNKRVLCFGEVLWDILPQGRKIGGAPLNVTYHLRKLGIEAALVSRVGNDKSGNEIREFLKSKEFSGSILQTDSTHPTSTVQARIGSNHEVSYDIINNVAWDFIEYDHSLSELIDRTDYLVYGSLILRNEVSRDSLYRLLEKPVTKVLDVNMRWPFYSKEILQRLFKSADIVKMNEPELQLISDWFGCQGNNEERLHALSSKFSLKILIATFGSKGAYSWHQDKMFFEEGYAVQVKDTVGSGDAFLAGFLSEYISGKDVAEALSTANRMGAFIAQKSGGCPEYDKKEFEMFSKEILNRELK